MPSSSHTSCAAARAHTAALLRTDCRAHHHGGHSPEHRLGESFRLFASSCGRSDSQASVQLGSSLQKPVNIGPWLQAAGMHAAPLLRIDAEGATALFVQHHDEVPPRQVVHSLQVRSRKVTPGIRQPWLPKMVLWPSHLTDLSVTKAGTACSTSRQVHGRAAGDMWRLHRLCAGTAAALLYRRWRHHVGSAFCLGHERRQPSRRGRRQTGRQKRTAGGCACMATLMLSSSGTLLPAPILQICRCAPRSMRRPAEEATSDRIVSSNTRLPAPENRTNCLQSQTST